MGDIVKVSPQEVRDKVQSGNALLVCAYYDDHKYDKMHLDGSVSLSTFKSDVPGIAKDREIIFF